MLHVFLSYITLHTLHDLKGNRGNCGSYRKDYEWVKRLKKLEDTW
jgi:hypothetical protein